MRESELLKHIYARAGDLASAYAGVIVGPGDDCAVVRTPGGDTLLLTVDQVVELRHYAPDTPIDLIARKAIARSISDIAAMGGTPSFALATAALPDAYPHADALFDAMARWARHWSCPLVGGDISSTPGPLLLTTTVVGTPHAARAPVLRSGARAGQGVYVTGALGGSLSSGRHLRFEPRLAEARALVESLGDRLTAMIDLSDGLGRDAARIAQASNLRIELDATAIPLNPGVPDWQHAAGDGEDYELLFTADGDVPDAVAGTPVTRIGRVIPGFGCVVIDERGPHDASELGWDHRRGDRE